MKRGYFSFNHSCVWIRCDMSYRKTCMIIKYISGIVLSMKCDKYHSSGVLGLSSLRWWLQGLQKQRMESLIK